AIVACVVPPLLPALKKGILTTCGVEALVVGDEAVDTGMEVDIETPEEIGADRLVNAVAARHYYGPNVVVIDMGTATTFDVVDHEGRYAGGVIAPGPQLSMEALQRAAARLSSVTIEQPYQRLAIGKNTKWAMQSGLYY